MRRLCGRIYTRHVSFGTGRTSAALRLAGALGVLALFLIAHGVQCASAASYPPGPAAIGHVMVIGPDGAASNEKAPSSAASLPTGPAHGAGHAAVVCVAVVAATIALLLGRRLRQSVADLAEPARRRLDAARSTAERWRANVPPPAVLCVSRT